MGGWAPPQNLKSASRNGIRVVQKPQLLNNFRVKTTPCSALCEPCKLSCAEQIRNRVIEQVHYFRGFLPRFAGTADFAGAVDFADAAGFAAAADFTGAAAFADIAETLPRRADRRVAAFARAGVSPAAAFLGGLPRPRFLGTWPAFLKTAWAPASRARGTR